MVCSYCGTENESNICSFCGADLNVKRPFLRQLVLLANCELPFNELVTFHTYDLLILLRLVREERSTCYKLMQTLKNGPENVLIDSGVLNYSEREYRRFTARMRVLEGILIDRMGYCPKRVDDKLLASLKAKIEGARK